MAEPNVIVAARQSYNNLEWYPGITPPNEAGLRQLYGEDSGCHPIVQMLDTKQVAASVDGSLVWWGFVIGMTVAVVINLVAQWGRKVRT